MKLRLVSLITICFYISAHGQLNDDDIRLQVLKTDIPEKVFVFGKWNEKDGTETHLNYLGKITSHDSEVFKIMTSSWFWGLTKKVTNLILVYTNDNKLLGNYYLDSSCILPNKIKDNKLWFKQSDCNECSNNVAELNIFNGKPGPFFLGCRSGKGSLFSFYQSL